MMRKPKVSMTLGKGALNYFDKVARHFNINRSLAAEFVAFSNECELDFTTLEYIYTNLFKTNDGRKKEKMPNSGV